MIKKHLVLLDLDGTTLYDWQTLTQETIDVIHQLNKLGHIICIATGRPYRSSKIFYDKLQLKTPIINYNGALIHHPYDDHFDEVTSEIDLNYVLKIFHDIGHLIANAFCEYYEDIYLYKMSDDIMPLIHPEGGKIIAGDFKDTLKLNPNGFILLTFPETYNEVEEYLAKNFKGILNFRNWGGDYHQIIEIYTPETNKGTAMKLIASYFDIPRERTITFGDGDNDVEMIQNAGTGVAMANAVDSVKQVAKEITLSNTENGVAHFLKEYFQL